ncbi:MAG: helix-turn-helix domain-containing protein [Defluviitaleaceae bacterium]|nr:helix-turn-helix domain-containing protein [Defluviitaleaceae bacterium]MCL2275616.1 helix-turn-helix domain-containing protein [Defluviitaleaceae bacterium]
MDNVRVGNRIAQLRKKNGFTQEALAEKFGISPQAISKWENGHTLPETALLPQLAALLQTSIDSILLTSCVEIGDVISFGVHQWRVLDINGDKALIITENVIEARAFHSMSDINNRVTWATSDIRKYLNGAFLRTLPNQSCIVETTVVNLDNPWYGSQIYADTLDKIFLLSYEELVRYFGDSGDLANRKGVSYDVMGLQYGDAIHDEYDKARSVLNLAGFNAWWWLRSPGGPRNHTPHDHVTAGSVDNIIWICGDDVTKTDGGVRPAMWVKM